MKFKSTIKLIISAFFSLCSINNIYAHSNDITSYSYYCPPKLKDKFQEINGPCWVFAGMATLETFLNKQGILKDSLSERHLLSWTNQPSGQYGWHKPIQDGGNSTISNTYFLSGVGPVYEKDCPYNRNNDKFNSNLSKMQPRYWIKGAKNIKENIKEIKNNVAQYGAVTVIYESGADMYHAVSIVGWNENKKSWIVKDSSKKRNCYVELPYSKKLYDCNCITDAEVFDPNRKIYQYDLYNALGYCEVDWNNIVAANVFDFEENEILDKVTVNSSSKNEKIDIYVSSFDQMNNTNSWVQVYSGIIPYDGYFTLDLHKKINLNKNKYAIIVKLSKITHNNKSLMMRCQVPYEKLTLKDLYQKSYLWNNGSFEDVKNSSELKGVSAFSIKAITIKS